MSCSWLRGPCSLAIEENRATDTRTYRANSSRSSLVVSPSVHVRCVTDDDFNLVLRLKRPDVSRRARMALNEDVLRCLVLCCGDDGRLGLTVPHRALHRKDVAVGVLSSRHCFYVRSTLTNEA